MTDMTDLSWSNASIDNFKPRKFEKLSVFDWLALNGIDDYSNFDLFEVSFQGGSRKEFCKNAYNIQVTTGDFVVIDTGNGYDIGKVSLSGDLVRLQMKKRKIHSDKEFQTILRHANSNEIERLYENAEIEAGTLVKSRAIAASLNLDMKLGAVEYQADRRKATFYYTSGERVDFRELVKIYAKEFKVKVEMRQIGIRQESSKIGGIGSCGRELCCSTWHTNFASVTTDMVKYQNLSVNQSKLTGLCSRLKCCLNYELDIYLEALEEFPKNAEILQLEGFNAYFLKLDIFKGIMYYLVKDEKERNKIYALTKERVTEIKTLNSSGKRPSDIGAVQAVNTESEDSIDFEDVTGQIELKENNDRNRSKKGKYRNNQGKDKNQRQNSGKNQPDIRPENRNNNKNNNRNNERNNENNQNRNKVNTNKNTQKPDPENNNRNNENKYSSQDRSNKRFKNKPRRFPPKNEDKK